MNISIFKQHFKIFKSYWCW